MALELLKEKSCLKILPSEVLSTLSQHILVDGFEIVIDLEKSSGNYIYDSLSGEKFLDCYSYFASLPLGHNHPKMFEPSFLKELQIAALSNPANSDIYCTTYAAFVKNFAQLAMPSHFKHLFFVGGGAPAVENALKCAFDWKVRKNLKKGKGELGKKVIYFDEAFHGRTGYALSCTHTAGVKIDYYPRLPWYMVENPKLRFPVTESVLKEVKEKEEKVLKKIKKILKEDGDDVAALIIEPIQGEGGDNHFRGEFLKELRKICDESDVMLVFDEIQTGCGATGKMWCYEHFGVVPDILVFGKKTQVCGIMVSERVDEVKENVFTVSGRINSTWGGNLVDMVRGIRYIEVMKEESLIEKSAEVGEYFVERLWELSKKSKGLISNVRGRGLFIAFDLPDGESRNRLRNALWGEKVVSLGVGSKSVRFRPALIFSEKEVDVVTAAIEKSLKKLK
ncbi:MAG: L-lysine 6-transaminase [Planctomycetota bacterium]|nr:L-lysine 6-transaminase [Planctomycetota bacterium]